jgi:hypothetical protein
MKELGVMENEKDVAEVTAVPSVFESEGKGKKIRAGTMTMVVGISDRLDELGETELDDYEYPELQDDEAVIDYDRWLG